jgi:HPt (histidine-containing phosphotransfer) domain-containing protein
LTETDPPSTDSTASDKQTPEQKLQAMIAVVWDRSRHTVVERAALLRAAADLLMEGCLDEATQMKAVDSAHKLAGVLGTFGLSRGTDLAREAEVFFGRSTRPDKTEIERLRSLLTELTQLIDCGPGNTV